MLRNPESGHELGTKAVEGNVASGGGGVAIAGIPGGSCFQRTSVIGSAIPPTSRSTPVASVMGDSNKTNSANTRSHTGMIAVWLNDILVISNRSNRELPFATEVR
jgi:hypothetical protein